MKKLIGLTLLTAALFADSYVEPTPPIPSEETPNDPATRVESNVDESSPDAPLDQESIEGSTVAPADQTPADEPSDNTQTYIDESYTQQPVVEPLVPMCCIPPDEYGAHGLFEFKMGYYRFGSKKLRHQYDEGVLDLQLSGTYRVWKPLYAYFSFEYIGANGRVMGSHRKIKIRMVPLSIGVRFLQKVTYDLKFYLTAGPRYFFVHQWTKRTSQTPKGFGGFVNTGFIYYLNHNFVIDLWGEYSFKTLRLRHLHGHHQVGGLALGAGIGYFW